MVYTYYSGDTKLISVSTKNMENVKRFDKMVMDKLEGKSLELELEIPAAEIQPAKKPKLSEDALSSYLGFFLQDGTYLDIANMISGTYYGFTKE